MGASTRFGWRRVVSAAFAAVVATAAAASATYVTNDERVEAQAEIAAQNTFQHADARGMEWVQERNEIKLGLRYYLTPVTQDLLGILHRPRLSILYRARYDSVFDVRDKYKRLGFNRDDFRFPEGEYPREMYFDGEFVKPFDWLSFRIGRQQVVWGEADLFRSLDVINPLRLDQNGLIGERFDDYREPLLIAKFLARLGNLPGIEGATLEFFYSPNSQPLTDHVVVGQGFRLPVSDTVCLTSSAFTVGVLPVGTTERTSGRQFKCQRPVGSSFSRVRYPWEVSRVGPGKTEAPNYADIGSGQGCHDGLALNGGCGDFVYDINDGWPRSWLSLNSSMAGARLFGQTFAGIDISFDYIFKRSEVPGTSLSVGDLFCPPGDPETILNPAFCRGDGQPNPRPSLFNQATAALATPDLNGNGFPDGVDEQVRNCVFRQQTQIIFASLHGGTPISGTGAVDSTLSPTLPGYQKAAGVQGINAFTGCEETGFWYPWTHILGLTATWNDNNYTGFIWRLEQSYSTKEPRNHTPPLAAERRGQYPLTDDFKDHIKRSTGVWRSMVGFDYLRSLTASNRLPSAVRNIALLRSLMTDQWFFTFQFFNEYYSHHDHQIGLLDSVTDRQYQFNPILTYVMTGFFMNNRLRPFIAAGYDVNTKFPVTWLQAEYYLTPKFSVRVGDIEYLGSKHAESFLFLHKYADRDTFFIRGTYFLL